MASLTYAVAACARWTDITGHSLACEESVVRSSVQCFFVCYWRRFFLEVYDRYGVGSSFFQCLLRHTPSRSP